VSNTEGIVKSIEGKNSDSSKSDRFSSERNNAHAQIRSMGEISLLTEDELIQNKIVYPGTKDRQLLNAFRELRTKLLQKSHNRNFICLISSLGAGGGASYVALNLAAVFALDKTKTSLLVDCNLYGPGVESVLDIGNVDGVTDFIENPEVEVKDIVYASGIPRLRVIPVGSNREAGPEHYASERMKEFFSAIKSRYDDRFILVDAPPVLSSAETRILADLCDMAVLVLPYGKVTQAQIDAGVSVFDKDKLAGVVFNN
jgi:Mrp family chromosome partitioning ATPase